MVTSPERSLGPFVGEILMLRVEDVGGDIG